ncbi:hypothetical protein KSP40_PGU011098 [Platanthera guangdongensis]|uniref:Snurportin-1 n=1 Tax=Platanthera guangdongensis TaxID=2320717 RepID=A0ABR2M8P6_9ASPA
MAPHELRRTFKRTAISDQQRRRDLALLRQNQQRSDSQNRARRLASSVLALPDPSSPAEALVDLPDVVDVHPDLYLDPSSEPEAASPAGRHLDVVEASNLKGRTARHWFSRQLMLMEWMIDVPPSLDRDWYSPSRSDQSALENQLSKKVSGREEGAPRSKSGSPTEQPSPLPWQHATQDVEEHPGQKYVFARPSGKRCFVVSSNGTTVSRLRNGSVLHRFPSSLPNGARTKEISAASHVFCILDCIFHEPDQTYYVIDLICWRGYSLYDCSAEFRFFWLNSKLLETGACDLPSVYHRYRFSVVPVYECNQIGLQKAYTCGVTFAKDGLLFYNRHANYQAGNTPLALVWKDEFCSKYVLDTDGEGQVPIQQQVVLELQGTGKLTTHDDPPIVFGYLEREFFQKTGLQVGNLLRFSIMDESVRTVDGKLELGEIKFLGKANRFRAFADSYSKVFFQHTARHSPLQFMDLMASVDPSLHYENTEDSEMIG